MAIADSIGVIDILVVLLTISRLCTKSGLAPLLTPFVMRLGVELYWDSGLHGAIQISSEYGLFDS
jgi:hypothetical protein